MDADYWLASPVLLSLLAYTTKNRLHRGGTASVGR